MYFLNDELVKLALEKYDLLDPYDPSAANNYFNTFCPGNLIYINASDPVNSNYPDRPFERFNDYENLLNLLSTKNEIKYHQMHKGTPFYFMSWLSIYMHNYKKALFYMDAAVSEDIRTFPEDWIALPAGLFLILDFNYQVTALTIRFIRQKLQDQILRFNEVSNLPKLTLESSFINKFINKLIQDNDNRSLISALYIYLLEYYDRYDELKLRSNYGGPMDPVLTHLFSGGLIFESLLKYCYPDCRYQTVDKIYFIRCI